MTLRDTWCFVSRQILNRDSQWSRNRVPNISVAATDGINHPARATNVLWSRLLVAGG
jgi:hypothetical protein